MKKVLLMVLVLALIGGMVFAGGKKEMAEEKDYLSMDWDQIIEEAKAEGEVTFYSWWGEEHWLDAGREFEKKYGIKTKIIIGDHTANVNKVISESKQSVGTIDAIMLGGDHVKTTIDAGVFYTPMTDVIPHYNILAPNLRDYVEGVKNNGELVPLYRNQTGILYNPDKVKNPPQTWDELIAWIKANPKRFGFNDPSKGGSGQSFVHTAIGQITGGLDQYRGDTEADPAKMANWDKVWDWMNSMEEYWTYTTSNNDSISRVNSGEFWMTIAWDDDTQVNLKKGTIFKDVVLYIPEMGFAGGGDCGGVLKNAKNKAAAILLLGYLTEKETQIKMNDRIGSYLARTDAKGKMMLLKEEERQNNAVAWIPAPYKKAFIQGFVQNVLMK